MSAVADATAYLVAYQQGRHLNIKSVATALGCYVGVDGTAMRSSTSSDIPEDVTTQLLLGAMRTDAMHKTSERQEHDGLSILYSLVQNDRWRNALQSVGDAYNLTVLLAKYLDTMANFRPAHFGDVLYAKMGPPIRSVLQAWIGADLTVERNVSSDMLARSLFCDAWCDLFIDGRIGYWEVKQLIISHRPPFRDGLVDGQEETIAQHLPTFI